MRKLLFKLVYHIHYSTKVLNHMKIQFLPKKKKKKEKEKEKEKKRFLVASNTNKPHK